jgi:hypothetical protein
MSLPVIAKRLEQTIANNSPAILTGIGVAGVVTTAYLAGTASIKAYQIIEAEREAMLLHKEDFPELKAKWVMEKVWKLYIPAVTTGTLTCAAIIGANRIGTRRAAAIAAAYQISERAFDDYKEKVVEKLGKGKEQEVRDEIAQEKVTKNVPNAEVYITGTGEVLCYDTITGRTFKSDMERLRQAQNDLNKLLIDNVYASLTDFYELIGLPGTPYSNEVGWNTENLLELSFSSTLAEGVPCIAVDYSVTPVREYWMNCP